MEKKVGHIIFKNLLNSHKKIIGINPNTKKILNQEIFSDLIEIHLII
jgi:predicted CoA-binding protein